MGIWATFCLVAHDWSSLSTTPTNDNSNNKDIHNYNFLCHFHYTDISVVDYVLGYSKLLVLWRIRVNAHLNLLGSHDIIHKKYNYTLWIFHGIYFICISGQIITEWLRVFCVLWSLYIWRKLTTDDQFANLLFDVSRAVRCRLKPLIIPMNPCHAESFWKKYKEHIYKYIYIFEFVIKIRGRHIQRDGVSNHQPHDCLLNRLFRCRAKKISKLRVTGLCRGIHRWPVNSPHKGSVTWKMFPFDNVTDMVLLRTITHPSYSEYHCIPWSLAAMTLN